MADKKASPRCGNFAISHWSLFVSLFCFSLWGFVMFLPTLAASSLQLFFSVAFCFPFYFLSWGVSLILHFLLWSHLSFSAPYVEGLLSFPVACNSSPVNAGIFLLKVHSTVQLKPRASLQQSWILFPHSIFEYCLTVKRYPQRRHFMHRQLISEKLFVLSLTQELVKGGWKAMYQTLLFSSEYCSITLRLKVQFAKVGFNQDIDVQIQMPA